MALRIITAAALALCISHAGAASDPSSPFACLWEATDEASAIACLAEAAMDGADKDDGSRAVEYAMGRGWFDATERIVERSSAASLDVSSALHQTATRIRNRLGALGDLLSKADKAAGIPPAFEWAQSPDSVFLQGE